ncbi:uncharacterized protein ALTATR162_LOCUS11980 [Alternaria atra]|uniref:Uncharacterized protein n=1 Tax=Alternaria atra TaxID=119953 RepID=A0A8J2ICI0_9PLEO|nr:uncharacterized protein ALTATR162_LOCUS11980 [Alternaria atra]CAG5188544.1 unnamed protein product [Alternaria atra]
MSSVSVQGLAVRSAGGDRRATVAINCLPSEPGKAFLAASLTTGLGIELSICIVNAPAPPFVPPISNLNIWNDTVCLDISHSLQHSFVPTLTLRLILKLVFQVLGLV